MLDIATDLLPHQVSLVPEKREEITTEGGLSLAGDTGRIKEGIARLNAAGIRTSLFIDPDARAVETSSELGAVAIELHTGSYAHRPGDRATIRALQEAARRGVKLGLAVHAGHGLTVRNVEPVARIPEIEELNIGHSVVSRAVMAGMRTAVEEMLHLVRGARH
jgi:pyridoxine 5-phosphate synthase